MKSELNFFEFNYFNSEVISPFISKRIGEIKLGENIHFNLNSSEAKYIIIGVSEDIGPQANLGFSGSKNAFNSFLTRFLNTQANRFLNGNQICIYGEIKQIEGFKNTNEARLRIEDLDQFVTKIVTPIIQLGKIPILIGGGHNNAFPLIQAAHSALKTSIDVINLDPHADCRPTEGRHSGNPFSYAKMHGFLNHYTVLGLHQQYNSESIYTYLDEQKFRYTFFEDYLDEKRNLKHDILDFVQKSTNTIGIELDLDSIQMMPTSAFTPSGFTVENARIYFRELAKYKNISYIHLPEGAPKTETEDKIVGKTLSYLVLDFIKENLKTKENN